MYRLDVSDRAEQDLDLIITYIAEKLAAPIAAADFAGEVYDCYDHLENNPYMYEKCRDPTLQKEGYRRAVVKNYLLVFKVDDTAGEVTVYRFFHGTQDYANLI